MKRIIISAFSVYPRHKSSEGIVNKNWIDILKKNDTEIKVLSPYDKFKLLSLFYKLSKQKEFTANSFIYKLLNKGIVYFFNNTIHNRLWLRIQKTELLTNIGKDEVVWVRVLPVNSLVPILKLYKKIKFPYIVNINDPLWISNEKQIRFTEEDQRLINTKDTAQAWTFPSYSLANRIADLYGFDKNRCFVIPHAMKENEKLYERKNEVQSVKVLYTGTFYKSAFTEELKNCLREFINSEKSINVTFTFVLSQYDGDSIKWLTETIPNVNLFYKLDRDKVINLIETHDCIFVVDSHTHTDLLKGKLVEAVSFGIPIFAASYKNSVMDKVVLEYGGISAYQDVEWDVLNKMNNFVDSIQSGEFFKEFYTVRQTLIDKVSEKYIYGATKEISVFAYNRFHGLEEEALECKLRDKFNWP